jgi:hypothetical protein
LHAVHHQLNGYDHSFLFGAAAVVVVVAAAATHTHHRESNV